MLSPIVADTHHGTTTFTGPGDVIPGAVVYWGLRAYSAATRGNKLANVCDAADAHCVDMLSDATTGNAIIPSSNPNCTSSGCTVKTLYDLIGNGCLAGTNCDVTQAIGINRPTLTIVSGKPYLTWSSSSQELVSTNAFAGISQPFSISIVAKRTSGTSQTDLMGVESGGGLQFGFYTANTAFAYAGLFPATASQTDGSFHAIASMLSGASTILSIDGSPTTINAGANGSGAVSLCLGGCAGVTPANTVSMEAGWWSGDKSASFAALSANQHSYWGF